MSDRDLRDIERLIVRHLDGELSSEDKLKLDREVLRNPEARELLDDYLQVDRLAESALHRTLGSQEICFDVAELAASHDRGRGRRFYRGWWFVPGAVAAALLAMVIPFPRFSAESGGHQNVVPHVVQAPPSIGGAPLRVGRGSSNPERPARNVGWGRHRVKRDTGREVIGVRGDDGNIYWIEVDRTWTVRRPSVRNSGFRPSESY